MSGASGRDPIGTIQPGGEPGAHQVDSFYEVLNNGIFDSATGTTTFYVVVTQTLKWSISRLSEVAPPYEELARPAISWVNQSGFFAKLVFFASEQVPDGTIEVFLIRHLPR